MNYLNNSEEFELESKFNNQIRESSKTGFDLDHVISPNQLFDPNLFLKQVFAKTGKTKTVHLIGLFSSNTNNSDLVDWIGWV